MRCKPPRADTTMDRCACTRRFETGALAETFQATGERAASLAQHQHEQARTLVASFEAPFKVYPKQTLKSHCLNRGEL